MKHRRARRAIGLGTLVLVLLSVPVVTGSAGGAPSAAVITQANGGGPKGKCTENKVGGTVKVADFSAPGPGFDPMSLRDPGIISANTVMTKYYEVYSSLARVDQKTGEFIPNIATSITPDASNLVWTIEIRDGVTFGDGSPLEASDVKFSIDRLLDPANTNPANRFFATSWVDSVEVIDPLTVQVTSTKPWPLFWNLFAGTLGYVLNEDVVSQIPQAEFNIKPPPGAGAGAYVVESNEPGVRAVFTAKTDWWNGAVCIETIEMAPVTRGAATLQSFQLGEVDVAYLYNEGKEISAAHEDGDVRYLLLNNLGLMMILNQGARETDPITKDASIRQAIAEAIDWNAIDQRLTGGLNLMESTIAGAETELGSKGLEGPKYDPENAAKLVKDYKRANPEWDGTLRVSHLQAPSNDDKAIQVEAYLTKAGFKPVSEVLTSTTMTPTIVSAADYELHIDWGLPYRKFPASAFVTMDTLFNVSRVYTGYDATEILNIVNGPLLEATTNKQAAAAIEQIQEIVNRDAPVIPYSVAREAILVNQDLGGLFLVNSGDTVVYDEAFWADKSRRE